MLRMITFPMVLLLALGTATVQADPVKGQKVYLKKLKSKLSMNGTRFAAAHTQDEWEELCEDDAEGFIKEYSQRYPKASRFLTHPKNLKKIKHVCDFAHEYASDSGNVPSCG